MLYMCIYTYLYIYFFVSYLWQINLKLEIVVTWVVRIHVGSGQTMELSTGDWVQVYIRNRGQ